MRQSNLRLAGIGALLALGVSACDSNKLTTINQDPNNPTSAPSGPVFTNAARVAVTRWLGAGAMDLRGPEFTAQHLAEVQYPDEDAYRRLGPGDTDADFINTYSQELKNFQAVLDAGKANGQPLLWGPAAVMRSLVFSYITDVWGDVPYSEALRGDSGVISPNYDAQKETPGVGRGLRARCHGGRAHHHAEARSSGPVLWRQRSRMAAVRQLPPRPTGHAPGERGPCHCPGADPSRHERARRGIPVERE